MANYGGFIILWRKILESKEYQDPKTRDLFMHCMLNANWKDTVVAGEIVPRGSFISSRKRLAYELTKKETEIRTAFKRLKEYGSVTCIGRAKNSLIIVKNYNEYQPSYQQNYQVNDQEFYPAIDQQFTNKTTTEEELLIIPNKLNNLNNTVVDIDSNKYINTTHVRAREENSTKNSIENSTATEGLAFVPLPGEPGDDRPESAVSQIIQAVEDSFVRTVSPTEIMTLKSWLEDMPADVIIMAIHEAAKNNVKNVAYVEGVLRSWRNNAVKSVEDAKEQQKIYASRIRNKQQQKTNTSIEQKPIVKKKRGFVMDENGEY